MLCICSSGLVLLNATLRTVCLRALCRDCSRHLNDNSVLERRLTAITFAMCSPRQPLPWHHIFLDLSLVKNISELNVAYSWQLQTIRLSWSLPLRFHPIFQSRAIPGSYVNSLSLKFHNGFITQVTGIKDTKPLVMIKNELNKNIKYTPINTMFFQKLKKGKFYLCIHSWKEPATDTMTILPNCAQKIS